MEPLLAKLPPDGTQYRAFQSKMLSIDEAARTIEFAASTESPDRYGDVIRVAGWELDNFQKNPVFLWAHRSEDPPIGRIIGVKKEFGAHPALVETVQFASADVYPFADTIFKLYKSGFMNAVSVGFLPKDYEPLTEDVDGVARRTGWDFKTVEQLELSAVPIPANPEALGRTLKSIKRRNGGFDMQALGHAILLEAKSLGVISGEDVEKCQKFFSFGESNPPWAYSIVGVTVAPPDNADTKKKEVSMNDEEKKAAEDAQRELNEKIVSLGNLVKKLEDDLKLQRDSGDDTAALKRRVKDLEENLKSLKTDHKSLQGDHKKLDKAVGEITNDLDDVSESVKGYSGQFDSFKKCQKDMEGDIEGLASKHKDLDGDIEGMKSSHKDLEDSVDGLRAKHKDLDGDVEGLKSKHRDLDSDVESLKKSSVEQKGAHSFLNNDHNDTKKRVKDLEGDVDSIKAKVKDEEPPDEDAGGEYAAPNYHEKLKTVAELAKEKKKPEELKALASSIDQLLTEATKKLTDGGTEVKPAPEAEPEKKSEEVAATPVATLGDLFGVLVKQ